jgi:hypothetical protein
LLALVVLQKCHAGGAAGSGSVTTVSRSGGAGTVLQMCHAGGVATRKRSRMSVSKQHIHSHMLDIPYIRLVRIINIYILH